MIPSTTAPAMTSIGTSSDAARAMMSTIRVTQGAVGLHRNHAHCLGGHVNPSEGFVRHDECVPNVGESRNRSRDTAPHATAPCTVNVGPRPSPGERRGPIPGGSGYGAARSVPTSSNGTAQTAPAYAGKDSPRGSTPVVPKSLTWHSLTTHNCRSARHGPTGSRSSCRTRQ